MTLFDHWHPVLLSRQLRSAPVGVRLAGRELALFRDGHGGVGALDDTCPHRRARLSNGAVCGGRLRCGYHGWTFDARGCGESPGTPKLHATADGMEAAERHGAVWVRARGSDRPFPAFEADGHHPAGLLAHRIRVPMELVVDNFTEMEHTPTTHASFGYPLGRMAEVRVQYDPTETEVRVTNAGPSKRFPLPLAVLMGLGRDAHFHDDWVTRFSPVHNVVDHYWTDPATGREARVRQRLIIVFTPVAGDETLVFTWSYLRSRFPLPAGGVPLYRWLVRRMLDAEIRRDARMLESLASKEVSVRGLKLSRFDRTLGLNRERIARVYRGAEWDPGDAVAAPGPAAGE